jgi:DNA mismatch endonuclease, patch repair protein
MADWLSREQRSHNMASIRSKGNATTEGVFLHILRMARISGWRRHYKLAGKPDFVFPLQRLAIFIDGCFWHGCPQCYRLPDDNRPYWREKVQTNRARDKRNARSLRTKGWKVLRFWEHSLRAEKGRNNALFKLLKAIEMQSLRRKT